jgi:hypothetical protein
MNDYKVGDRVIGVNKQGGYDIIGKTGTVIKVRENNSCSVEFDDYMKGHSCGDICEYGHGLYVDYENIKPLPQNEQVVIYRKDRRTIAILKQDKKIVKKAVATCHPNDEFNEGFGRDLAYARLKGDKETEERLLKITSPRVVKQDEYKIGDKVKIMKDLRGGHHYNHLHFNPKMEVYRGKIGTVTSITNFKEGHFRIDIDKRWEWNAQMIEGKVVEEPEPQDFDWEGFKKTKFAVHCKNQNESMSFLQECEKHDIKWEVSGKATNAHTDSRYYTFGYCANPYLGAGYSKSIYINMGMYIVEWNSEPEKLYTLTEARGIILQEITEHFKEKSV